MNKTSDKLKGLPVMEQNTNTVGQMLSSDGSMTSMTLIKREEAGIETLVMLRIRETVGEDSYLRCVEEVSIVIDGEGHLTVRVYMVLDRLGPAVMT